VDATNGHVLYARMTYLEELTPKKEVVWHYDPPAGTETHSLQPIGLDKVLFVQNGTPAKIIVMNKATKAVEVEHALTDAGATVHPQFRRIRMTARLATGREALTEYRVQQRFDKFTYLEVRIGTGRTHQIRVHLASLGHPVAGDRVYGAPPARRMFLHAWRIGFDSPATGKTVRVEAPLPPELDQWLREL